MTLSFPLGALIRVFVICLGLPLWLMGQEGPSSEFARFQSHLEAQGIPSDTASDLTKAAKAFTEDDEPAPLKPFLSHAHSGVVITAAALLFDADAEGTTGEIARHLREKKGSRVALLLALSFSYTPEGIDLLLQAGRDEADPQHAAAIKFSLRVMTGQSWATIQEWAAWWKADRETFVFPEPDNLEEHEQRMRAALAVSGADALRKALGSFLDKPRGSAESTLGKLFGGVLRLLKQGGEMRVSDEAQQADRQFSEGRLEEAVTTYGKAVAKDQLDLRSRFLRGCVLFELGRFSEAQSEFGTVHTHEPKAVASAVLAQMCARAPIEPGKGLTTFRELASKLDPKPDLREFPIGDPVVQAVVAQSMTGGSVVRISEEQLELVAKRHPADVALLVAIASLHLYDRRAGELGHLRKLFPGSAFVLAVWMENELIKSGKGDNASFAAALDHWRKLEPENRISDLFGRLAQRTRELRGSPMMEVCARLADSYRIGLQLDLLRQDWGSNEEIAALELQRKELQKSPVSPARVEEMGLLLIPLPVFHREYLSDELAALDSSPR